ncbi:MAG: TolC family protein [Candidatus Aminicenantes bacterium]|jgi:outer membrane protein TolC
MRKTIRSIFLFLWFVTFSFSQENLSREEVYTLRSAISTAIARNPLVKSAQFKVEKADKDVKKAVLQKYTPKMDFYFYTGLVPEARGNIFFSPDKQTDLDKLGPFYRFDLQLIQPLFTFGRTTTAIQAAKEALHIEESEQDHVLQSLSFEVAKAYWGLLSAQKAVSLAENTMDSYEELLSEIRARIEDETSEVDDLDLLEAQSFYIDVEQIRQESIEYKTMARKTFNTLLDFDLDEKVKASDEPLLEFSLDEGQLDRILEIAQHLRPEIRSMQSGLRALQAKTDLAKKQRYPVLFLAAGLRYAYAGHREDQTNPFVVDNFNYRDFGAMLGLRWDPNIFVHNVEVQKNFAEYSSALEKMRQLKAHINLEVSQAFAEARRNDALWKAAKSSLKAARTWLRTSLDNWELGIGEAYRLLRAYQAYYRLRKTEIDREYKLNVSIAKLAYTLGDMKLFLKWTANGRVDLNS